MNEYRVRVYDDRTEWYDLKGNLHREEGPAVEHEDGTKLWYIDGKLHRKGGPAIERPTGTKGYYQRGMRHREDGPACEWSDGKKEWYLEDEYLTEEGFNTWHAQQDLRAKDPCHGKTVDIDGKKYKLELV